MDLALAAQVLLWLVVIEVFLISRRASVFHPFTCYLAFHGLVFVVRPLLVCYADFDHVWNAMYFRPTDAQFVHTLFVSSIGLLAFGAACVPAGGALPAQTPAPRFTFTRQEWGGFLAASILLVPLMAASIIATRNGVGGERIGGAYIMTDKSGYLVEAQFMLGSMLCLWLMASQFHWTSLAGFGAYCAYRAWFGWSRFTIVLFLFGIFLLIAWRKRRRWPPWWSVGLMIPVLAVFHVLGMQRDILRRALEGQHVQVARTHAEGLSEKDKLRTELDGPDYANFDFLAFILSVVPERTGTYTHGVQYLQLFTEPIPRKLWPGKPIGAPVKYFNLNHYGNFVGMTVSLPGDAWMTGGWAGLILIEAAAGWLLGRVHRWFWRFCGSPVVALFYTTGLAMTPQLFRDGGVVSMAKFILFGWFPLLVWVAATWLLGDKRMKAAPLDISRGSTVRLVAAPATGTIATAAGRKFVLAEDHPQQRG